MKVIDADVGKEAEGQARQPAPCGRERQRQTLIERVRQNPKFPPTDRPLLAERLGEMAARLSPEKPLTGARRIIEALGHDAKWGKRKRLVRLPGEQPSNPSDGGAYESSSATWAAVVIATAKLLADSPDPMVAGREHERWTRDILRGTSFLPGEIALPTGADGLREIISDWAISVCNRINRECDLAALWEVLRASPFTTTIADDDAPPTTALETAARRADLLSDLLWKTPHLTRFTDAGGDVEWSYPRIKIGALAQTVRRRIFIVPTEMESAFLDPNKEEGPRGPYKPLFDLLLLSPEELEAYRAADEVHYPNEVKIHDWLRSIGATEDKSGSFDLPDRAYSPDLDYGWQEETVNFERPKEIWLHVRPKNSGGLGLYISIEKEQFGPAGQYIPRNVSGKLFEKSIGTGSFFAGEFLSNEGLAIECNAGTLIWPSWCDESHVCWGGALIDRIKPKPGGMIGLVEMIWVDEWLEEGLEGWLDDPDNLELASFLFTAQPDVRMAPLVAVEDDAPLPCASGTIGAALLRNLAAPEPEQIASILTSQARLIADAGMGYHRDVLAYYRAMVENLDRQ